MNIVDQTVHLPVDPDQAFELITQSERLRRWLAITARIELRVGGEYRWTVVPGAHAVGTIREVEPGERIVFEMGWADPDASPAPGESTLSITLTPVEGGTSLRLLHEGLTEESARDHAEGWEYFLGRLVQEASGGEADLVEWTDGQVELGYFTAAECSLAILQHELYALSNEDLERPTPCSEFTVEQLLEHLADNLAMVANGVGADVVNDTSQCLMTRIPELAAAAIEAFEKRGVEGPVQLRAEVPGPVAASILNVELLVHAWDIAAALERTLEVEDRLSSYVEELTRGFVTDDLRKAGVFAPAISTAEGAAGLESLLAFTGRRVNAGV